MAFATPAHRPIARPAERGSVLMISLLLLVVLSFLGGLVMMLAKTESGAGTGMRASTQAFNAAEYGLNFTVSSLDPAAPAPTPISPTSIPAPPGVPGSAVAGLQFWSGDKTRTPDSLTPLKQGEAACPPGYSLTLGCQLYQFTATGQSKRFGLVVTATTELQAGLSIYKGCAGTNYGC